MPKRSYKYTNGALVATPSQKKRYFRNRTTGVSKMWPKLRPGLSPIFDPFPNQMRTRVRYSQVIALDPNVNSPDYYNFRCNSIFDPDQTGVGHQPYGFDILEQIYLRYKVESSVIEVKPTEQLNGMFGVLINPSTSPQLSYETVREQKGSTWAAMTAGGKMPKVQQKWQQDDTYAPIQGSQPVGAAMSANPSDTAFFQVWYEAINAATEQGSASFVVSITYDVTCFNLKQLAQS